MFPSCCFIDAILGQSLDSGLAPPRPTRDLLRDYNDDLFEGIVLWPQGQWYRCCRRRIGGLLAQPFMADVHSRPGVVIVLVLIYNVQLYL